VANTAENMEFAWLGVVLLVIGPGTVLCLLGARPRWIFVGILSWMLALAIKIPALLVVYGFDGVPAFPISATAILHGLISAAAELGMAALLLHRSRLSFLDALAFGVGVGSFEVVWVLWEGSLELIDSGDFTGPNALAMASGPLLLERAITLISHTASRLLVYISVVRRYVLPAAIAVALFALCDGVAVYGGLAGWRWEHATVRYGFNAFLAALAAVEMGAAWFFSRRILWPERSAEPAEAPQIVR
jgi:hypothetical protein